MKKNRYLSYLILSTLFLSTTIEAQIVVDHSAAKNQQPTVTNTASGLPQINIQTPSVSGVSRNTYQQFDVDNKGLILNNSRNATQTQLGGWIQGNPWINGEAARIILNEVNSNNPSFLNGYIEVAGNKAQVVVANPSGISCDGCGFINANHVVLTTGIPILENGNLKDYLVERGVVTIQGKGLDASTTDYTEIISHAVAVNAGIWANDLKITAKTSAKDNQEKSTFAIDTAELGGMYAGKITLVATGNGVGVRNAGHIGASAGEVVLTADGLLENSGQITSSGNTHINVKKNINNHGVIYAGENTSLVAQENIHNKGVIASSKNTDLSAQKISTEKDSAIAAGMQSDGSINQEGNLTLNASKEINVHGQIFSSSDSVLASPTIDLSDSKISGRNLNFTTTDSDLNTSRAKIEATDTLTTDIKKTFHHESGKILAKKINIKAATIENNDDAEIAAQDTQLTAYSAFTNRGLVDGNDTRIKANTLNNVGFGRLYGDHLMLDTNTLINDSENGIAAIMAARQRLDIATQVLNNNEHALIFSAGDMAIGGSFNSDNKVIGKAISVNNNSATVEALGNLDLSAKEIRNTNAHFSTKWQETFHEFMQEYQLSESPNRYDRGQISITFGETWFLNTPEGFKDDFNRYDYTRSIAETQIAESDPGKILASGTLNISSDNVLNDKSQIIAGGDLNGNIGVLTNTEAAGQRITTDTGEVHHFFRIKKRGIDKPGEEVSGYNPPAIIEAIALHPSTYKGNTKPDSSKYVVNPTVIRTGEINTHLPDSALFQININPKAGGYLIETDPRFTHYRSWLSSDYMLQQLGTDSSDIQKRLGDGFYEQKLIREQIAQLTGRRFLEGYNNDEDEYRTLIDNGVTYAKKWNLRPGVALTQEQMAQLTTDIVWLVEKEITLSDGSTTKALVPEVYMRVKENDVRADGALIRGDHLQLNLANDLINSGSLKGQTQLTLTAENIHNLGGRINGADATLYAKKDFNNLGGTLDAEKNLNILAGNNVHIASTTHTEENEQGSRTNIERVASISVSDPNSKLMIAAGNDIDLNGVKLTHIGESGSTTIAAGRNLNLGTVEESNKNHIVWNADNQRHDSSSQEVGTVLQTKGNITLSAANDLNTKGAHVKSEEGELMVGAGKNINISATQANQDVDESHKKTGSSSLFSRSTTSSHGKLSQSQALGSTFDGKSVVVQAGEDLNLTGSQIISTQDTHLVAGNNIHLNNAIDTRNEEHSQQEKKIGVFKSNTDDLGFTIGVQKQSAKTHENSNTVVASTVASTNGNVSIEAGNHYRQTGSEVLAPIGDVNISAKNIEIKNAENINSRTQENKFEQAGLSLTMNNPILNSIQTGQEMRNAARQTDDLRLQTLAGLTAGVAIKNAADSVLDDPKKLGGTKLDLSVGINKSESKSSQNSSTVSSSTIMAGHDVDLSAVGAGKDGNITIQGSDIHAGHNVSLKADKKIDLLAAKNTFTEENKNRSGAVSIGVGIGISRFIPSTSLDTNLSLSKEDSDSEEIAWRNTTVNAGNKLTLDSGDDTTLKGAIASGDKVNAHVGGDLNIESLQNTRNDNSHAVTFNSNVSMPILDTSGVGASGNIQKTNIDSQFASVDQQSGIQAGDEGFQIDVKNNTNLIGAVISSTEEAIKADKNALRTGTLTTKDIDNHAEYSAKSFNASTGYDFGSDIKKSLVTPSASMHAKDKADSTTKSGISGAEIIITDKDNATTLSELNREVVTGRDTSNALSPIFNEKAIKVGFEITGALTTEVGTYLDNRARESTLAQEALNQERLKASIEQDPDKIAAFIKTIEKNKTWEMGGTGRRIVTALTTAANGNVTGNGVEFIQNAAVNYLQSLEANQIKKIADKLNSETARIALHSVLACGGAALQGESCTTAASGAAASVVLNNLMDGISGKNADNLSAKEKQARENIISGIVSGIVKKAGGDEVIASTAARIEAENNSLALVLMPPPPLAVNGGVPKDKNFSGEYIEVSALKKYLGSWVLFSNVAADVINIVLNESDLPDAEVDVPVVSEKARKHILDGDEEGGGHRAGTGKPGKSEFPADWSEEEIIKEISRIASDPEAKSYPSYEGRTVKKGSKNGINIDVVVDANKQVISGYPTNVRRNPWR